MSIFDKDHNPLAVREALDRHIERALAAEPPGGLDFEILYRTIKSVCKPEVYGAENIPDRPCLFVGNHSLFALDGAIILPLFNKELGRFPRAMGDRFLFSVEPVASLLLSNGLVMGHPEVCSALMEDGQDLLVFPGGAFEAVKPSSERYRLQWKERLGFVKMAARYGYTIVPFGLVGPDDFYNHLYEGRDFPESVLGRLLGSLGLLNENTRTDIFPPLPLGSLGTMFPRPQRCYLGFGEPLDLSEHQGKKLGKKALRSLRSRVAREIEGQLSELLAIREENRDEDGLLRRLLTL
jgi:1-acyl-sn-glycerol-3-phosphate acyltransferase